MDFVIVEKRKKRGGKYYVVIGKSEDSPATLIFGRYKKLEDAKRKAEQLEKKYGFAGVGKSPFRK
jgi:hypothetical protein